MPSKETKAAGTVVRQITLRETARSPSPKEKARSREDDLNPSRPRAKGPKGAAKAEARAEGRRDLERDPPSQGPSQKGKEKANARRARAKGKGE